jgi:hypothetical protein
MIIYVHEGDVVLLSEMRVDDDFDAEKLGDSWETFHLDLQ